MTKMNWPRVRQEKVRKAFGTDLAPDIAKAHPYAEEDPMAPGRSEINRGLREKPRNLSPATGDPKARSNPTGTRIPCQICNRYVVDLYAHLRERHKIQEGSEQEELAAFLKRRAMRLGGA